MERRRRKETSTLDIRNAKKRIQHLSHMGVAQQLQSKRTNDGTKLNYASKVKIITEWMLEYSPESIDEDGHIKIPAEKEAVLKFFGHICSEASKLDSTMIDSYENDSKKKSPMSVSNVKGYRSALVDLYKKKHLQLDPCLDTELKAVLDGYEKLINNLKKDGKMKNNEGKRHLKPNGYTMLAEALMKKKPWETGNGQSWTTVTFAWSFFVLMWNLMSRADSVDSIMLQHIEWSEDSLVIEEQGHKGDQTGENKYGKHIYANPFEPEKCPILSLSVLLFSTPTRSREGRQQLFAGTNSKERFGHLLRQQVFQLNSAEINLLGCCPEDIGTHSLRKGGSTYALGQVSGPNPVTVFLRMGQSLGKLKDRYIHASEGADQLCGRMIAGLPFDDIRFGVLPPHFNNEIVTQLNSDFWENVIGGYEYYPTGIKCALPFFLASLVYHEKYLHDQLHPTHPIFLSRAFTHNPLLEQMRKSVLLGIGKCDVTQMRATGIPSHLSVAKEVNKLVEEQEEFKKELREMKEYIYHDLPTKLAIRLTQELRENFQIDGVSALTMRDIDRVKETIISELREEIRAVSNNVVPSSLPHSASENSVWKTWNWNDGLICHFVPPNWSFPERLSSKTLWDLWFFGQKNQGIRPLYLINKAVDIQKKQHMMHTRAKRVMQYYEKIVNDMNLLPSNVSSVALLSISESDKVFEMMYEQVIKDLYDNKKVRRPHDICYGRIYNLLCQFNKKNKQ
jgi:archaellum component FlaC